MAQTRSVFPANVDNVDKVIFSVAKTTQKKLAPKWKKTFRIEKSDRKFERRVSMGLFTTVPEKAEGDDFVTQTIDQGFTKDFTALEFGLAFVHTQTAQEDDEYGVLAEKARGLTTAAIVTEEQYAARLHNLATSTEKTPDLVVIYSAAHLLVKGGTFSNLSAEDLSRPALESAITLFHTDHKSDEGHFMEPSDGYILEVPPALEWLAHKIVASRQIQGSAENDTNALRDRYSIEVMVNPYFSDTDSWRLVAKGKNHGLLSYTRVPMNVEPVVKDPYNNNLISKIRFRRSWGADRAQGIVGSVGA